MARKELLGLMMTTVAGSNQTPNLRVGDKLASALGAKIYGTKGGLGLTTHNHVWCLLICSRQAQVSRCVGRASWLILEWFECNCLCNQKSVGVRLYLDVLKRDTSS